jgi:hypothetical protein
MAEPLRNVAFDIRLLVEAESPRSYCDACLAFGFDVSLDEARAMARTLAGEAGFIRQQGKCDNCGRVVETIGRRVAKANSRRSFP